MKKIWYVDKKAKGSNNGTSPENAWISSRFIAGVKPGDIIHRIRFIGFIAFILFALCSLPSAVIAADAVMSWSTVTTYNTGETITNDVIKYELYGGGTPSSFRVIATGITTTGYTVTGLVGMYSFAISALSTTLTTTSGLSNVVTKFMGAPRKRFRNEGGSL